MRPAPRFQGGHNLLQNAMTITDKEQVNIRPAIPGQAQVLTSIAIKAKGHWGYSEQQLAFWSSESLSVSPEYVAANLVWVASVDSQPVAFAALKKEGAETILDHLWVLPERIGQGIGRELFLHLAQHLKGMDCREFLFTSDPHADGFYYKMGAEKIGDWHSGFQGRVLTKFRYRVRD
jgi:GNAT superfamily N-acetyltransferase